jgi:hypothetical protein
MWCVLVTAVYKNVYVCAGVWLVTAVLFACFILMCAVIYTSLHIPFPEEFPKWDSSIQQADDTPKPPLNDTLVVATGDTPKTTLKEEITTVHEVDNANDTHIRVSNVRGFTPDGKEITCNYARKKLAKELSEHIVTGGNNEKLVSLKTLTELGYEITDEQININK